MASPVAKPDLSPVRLRFDRFELDEANARLACAGEPIALAPRPFAVLCALARTPRMLVTKNALLDAVWSNVPGVERLSRPFPDDLKYGCP